MAEFLTLSTAARAAFLTMLLEPSVQTRFTKVLATAHSQVRFTENFGADLTNEAISYFTNKVTVVSSEERHWKEGGRILIIYRLCVCCACVQNGGDRRVDPASR